MIQTDNTTLAVAQALIALRDENKSLKAENEELRYIVEQFKKWSAEGGCPLSHNPDFPCWWEQHRLDEDCSGYCAYEDEAEHGCWVEYYRWKYQQEKDKGGENEQ